MTPETATTGLRSAPRWVLLALLASLAVNMAVLGLAAGRFWAHRHDAHGHFAKRDDGIRAIMRDLPEERREVVRALRQKQRTEIAPLREEVGRARQEVREVMAREPMDKAALAAALERVNAARAKLGESAAAGLVAIVEQLTPAERKALAKREGRRKGRHGGLFGGN